MGFITKTIDADIPDVIATLQTAIKQEADPNWVDPVPVLEPGYGTPDDIGGFSETVEAAATAARTHESGIGQVTCVLQVPDADTLGDPENGSSFKYNHIESLKKPPQAVIKACMDWYYKHNSSIEQTAKRGGFRYLEGFYVRVVVTPGLEIVDHQLLAKYTDE